MKGVWFMSRRRTSHLVVGTGQRLGEPRDSPTRDSRLGHAREDKGLDQAVAAYLLIVGICVSSRVRLSEFKSNTPCFSQ